MMAGCDVNKLITRILGQLLDRKSPQVPLTYGDPKLQELLSLVEYASIERFQFVDGNGTPSKRNLHQWLKNRAEGRRLSHEKLCGFAEFAAVMSWRGDFADLVHQLLDHPEVQNSVHLSTFQGEVQIQRLRSIVTRNPYLQNQQGHIPINKKYGVIQWRHEIDVDADGNGMHEFNVHICNLLTDDLSLLTPPIFVDRPCAAERLQPWASVDGEDRHMTARIEGWNGTAGAVFLELKPPIEPYHTAVVRWGYTTPSLFAPGDEYYRFDINNPTAHRVASIRFARVWSISRVRTLTGRQTFERQQNTVRWEHFFPSPDLYEVRFDLARKSKSE